MSPLRRFPSGYSHSSDGSSFGPPGSSSSHVDFSTRSSPPLSGSDIDQTAMPNGTGTFPQSLYYWSESGDSPSSSGTFSGDDSKSSFSAGSSATPDASIRANRLNFAHPYARLNAKRDNSMRHRKLWNHVHEKCIFDPDEISTISAPERRLTYFASLESHIDLLHNQMLDLGLYPVALERLEPYRGINDKIVKGMVSGLQYEAWQTSLKLRELERSTDELQAFLDEYDDSAPVRKAYL